MMRRSGNQTRRAFLAGAAGAGLISCGSSPTASPGARKKTKPVILLRSGWQIENIGDIAHTPGVLRLLAQRIPEADVILWSNALGHGVERMLRRNFPRIRFVRGDTDEGGVPDSEPLRQAFEEADFLLHGSGPSVVAHSHVAAWRQRAGKPYGILGVTITARSEAASTAMDPALRDLLEGASFVYTRETKSLENLNAAGITGPVLGFAPDGTFSLNIRNDERAQVFLDKYELEQKRFIAVVPRLRYTPYHKFRKVNWSEETIRHRTEVNERHAEEDHAKLRHAITTWVRETGHKVLLCPEMTYQVDIIDPLLFRPLPNDVKKNVVRRLNYWLTDEAASVYRQAVDVISFECHSPIIAVANDTPCLYVHQPEDGIKGQMWRDVGLTSWRLEVEESTGEDIANRLLADYGAYDAAQVHAHEAVLYARMMQGRAMDTLRGLLLG